MVRVQLLKTVIALLIGGLGLSAEAGPPFVTDDPEPVEPHHMEINLAFQRTRSDAARSGTLAADVNWGCARELQCHVAVPLAFSKSSGEPMQAGLGDGEVGLKYRFFNRPDLGLMAAVYPTVFLASGAATRGLGNGDAQFLLPAWLQLSSGPWTWDAGSGYLVNRAAGGRSSWFVDLLAQRSFGEGLKLGAEVFHRAAVADPGQRTSGFNVGAVVKLSASRNLLASVGRGLQGLSANRASVYVAYQFEL